MTKIKDEELKEKLNIYGKFPNGMTSSDFYDYIQNEAELKGRQEREQEILKIIGLAFIEWEKGNIEGEEISDLEDYIELQIRRN